MSTEIKDGTSFKPVPVDQEAVEQMWKVLASSENSSTFIFPDSSAATAAPIPQAKFHFRIPVCVIKTEAEGPNRKIMIHQRHLDIATLQDNGKAQSWATIVGTADERLIDPYVDEQDIRYTGSCVDLSLTLDQEGNQWLAQGKTLYPNSPKATEDPSNLLSYATRLIKLNQEAIDSTLPLVG